MAVSKGLQTLKKAETALEKIFTRVSQIPEFSRLSQLSDAMREWKAAVEEVMEEQARNIADLEHRLAHTKTATDADAWTREELLAVHKLARSIRVARQPEEIAEALLHLVARVLDVIEAEIFVELEEADAYTPLTPVTERPALHTMFQHYVEEGIIAWVIDAQKALVVDELETVSDAAGDAGRRYFVVVPIILHAATAGIYLIHTWTSRDKLDDAQLELVTLLTEHAAGAIENLRLTARLKDMRREESERSQV